jgi:FKBP-type peptidyl-prolyl cis-trans isomerase FkpA
MNSRILLRWASLTAAAALAPIVTPALNAATGEGTSAPQHLSGCEAVGFSIGNDLQLAALNWSDAQFAAFVAGLRASIRGEQVPFSQAALAEFEAVSQQINAARGQRTPPAAAPNEPAGETIGLDEFMEQARKNLSLQRDDRGLLFRIDRYGSGPRPSEHDVVTISYQGRSPEHEHDLAEISAQQARVKVADLMPGLAYAVQMLALDGRGTFLLPPELTFAQGPWPNSIPPGAPLLFRVHLHDLEPAETAASP